MFNQFFRFVLFGDRLGARIGEVINSFQPGGFRGIGVDQHDYGDGAGPVRVQLIPLNQRHDKPDYGDRHGEKSELKGSFLEGFDQTGHTCKTGDVLEPHSGKPVPAPVNRPETKKQDDDSGGPVERQVWRLLFQILTGHQGHDR